MRRQTSERTPQTPDSPVRKDRSWLSLAAWCSYDWANSAFSAVITTFIFAVYFAQSVAPSAIEGTILWSRAVTVAGLTVALASPLLGAIADSSGPRKPWLLVFTGTCVVLIALMWFVRPQPEFVYLALALFAAASITFNFAIIFYDAMLKSIAPPELLGRISGWGWAAGYVGGLVCLLLCLWIVKTGGEDVLGLNVGQAEPVRATVLLVALWFAAFSIPLFMLTPDRPPSGRNLIEASGAGLRQLPHMFAELRRNPPITRFLIAHMLYTDGLVTLFAFGGIYAAAEFAMTPEDILVFGIVLNITAGLGAAGFAWVDDAIGSKRTIMLALTALILAAGGLLLTRSDGLFWTLAAIIGLFVGPTQAAGRSLMARLAPAGIETEMFGLYAFAGKATAFSGPLVLGLAVGWSGSQRVGMATILVFLFCGLLVLMSVRDPGSNRKSPDTASE